MTKIQRQGPRSPQMNFQREFLGLAGTYLACRLRVLGGDIERMTIPEGDLRFSLLGMTDHSGEMRLPGDARSPSQKRGGYFGVPEARNMHRVAW